MTSEVAFSPNDDYIGEYVFLYIVYTILKLIDDVILKNPIFYLYMQQCIVNPSLRPLSLSL